jgi:hypothetical protein
VADRLVRLWVRPDGRITMLVTASGVFVCRNHWHSWIAVLAYLRRFDPAIYNLTVTVSSTMDNSRG